MIRLLVTGLLGLASCVQQAPEEPYVDSGIPLTCPQKNMLTGSLAFEATQGVECFSPLPDGGPAFDAVVLQVAASEVSCAPDGNSPVPICSGAGIGKEVYLQYGTPQAAEPMPLAPGTWEVENVGGAPWVIVFFTDNVNPSIYAHTGEVLLTTVSPTEVAGEFQNLGFALPDGGVGTLSGPFCTSFCGILTDGG